MEAAVRLYGSVAEQELSMKPRLLSVLPGLRGLRGVTVAWQRV